MTLLAAEPASIFYVVTGTICLLFNRRAFSRRAASSSFMLFCQRTSREKLSGISLT
jgi:hypothetical protein